MSVICGFVWVQEQISKRHVSKRGWTMCSSYDNHCKLTSQHNGGERGCVTIE